MPANQIPHYNAFEAGKDLPSGIGEAARFRHHVVGAAVYNGFLALSPMLPRQEPAETRALPSAAPETTVPTQVEAMPVAEAPAPTILDEDDSDARGVAARNVIDAIHAETVAGRIQGDYDLAA